jgi:hypothetical protein
MSRHHLDAAPWVNVMLWLEHLGAHRTLPGGPNYIRLIPVAGEPAHIFRVAQN